MDMIMIKRWGGRVFTTVCFSAVGKGVLLWLASLGIYPDRWVAAMIEYATALQISVAAQWMLLGGVGLVGTIAWEVFGLKTWIMRAISRLEHGADDWIALHEASRIAY